MDEPTERIQEDYAQLLVDAVGLGEGGRLALRGEPIHWPLFLRIARVAYERGAEYVHVLSEHAGLYKTRIDAAFGDSLDYVPSFVTETYLRLVEEGWSLISLVGPEDPDLLETLDPDRNAKAAKANAEALRPFREAIQSNQCAWCVAAAPTSKWAAKFLEAEPNDDTVQRAWQLLRPILKLDQDDPTGSWTAHMERLEERARVLTDLRLSALRFTTRGTDLEVALLERSRWVGGGEVTVSGRRFFPNIPTEEVFTTPHREGTNGYASVTRPVLVLGQEVSGAWFEFQDGRVIDFGAEKNAQALEKYFSLDDRARYLGEIALVDSENAVFQSGTVFYNILYDENAACHMALGSSYPTCIEGGASLSQEDYEALGGNRAVVHTDFMIGTPDINVTGVTASGEHVHIMENGRFVLGEGNGPE